MADMILLNTVRVVVNSQVAVYGAGVTVSDPQQQANIEAAGGALFPTGNAAVAAAAALCLTLRARGTNENDLTTIMLAAVVNQISTGVVSSISGEAPVEASAGPDVVISLAGGVVESLSIQAGTPIENIGTSTNPELAMPPAGISQNGYMSGTQATQVGNLPLSPALNPVQAAMKKFGVNQVVAYQPNGTSTIAAMCFDGVYLWICGIGANTLIQWDVNAAQVVNTVSLGSGAEPLACCYDGVNVWVCNYGNGTVSVVNASTATLVTTISLPSGAQPRACCFDGNHVWIVDGRDTIEAGVLYRYNQKTQALVDSVAPSPAGALSYIEWDGTNIWCMNRTYQKMLKVNAAVSPPTVISQILVPDPAYGGIYFGGFDGNRFWLGNGDSGNLCYFDRTYGLLYTYSLGGGSIGNPTFDGQFMWVPAGSLGKVAKFNAFFPNTLYLAHIADYSIAENNPGGACFDGKNLWVTSTNFGWLNQM